ncbi:TetR family transcriptional regulator [Caulobacter sp. SLTY]|uniref:TetR/AcrR family transcriptional regulator n=1 Tax=Caulobacter sp. SLTY TaxID=2683262 RepID=UPI001412008E|nr:TetR/AcrR family transcriptional regulator [Caulobacter sp. SLTY]NBB15235.1 TetR family transcriptional regulator [Caulobacter sp. SLTY]
MGEREGETRTARKRRDILDSGREIFLNEGYAGAGMEMVARSAAVSTATLYAHFPSKADLFAAVVDEAVTGLTADLRSTRDHGDARARLTQFAVALGRFYCEPLSRSLFRLVTAERRRFAELADRFQARSRQEIGGVALALIKELADDGLLKVDDPASAAGQLLGMLEHPTLTMGLMAGDETQPQRPVDTIGEEAVETFLARYAA